MTKRASPYRVELDGWFAKVNHRDTLAEAKRVIGARRIVNENTGAVWTKSGKTWKKG
jgi:hypothetical protein